MYILTNSESSEVDKKSVKSQQKP
jgi:hypothetical protein